MDRVEIKSLAKEKIKGNLWTIWKPMLIVVIVSALASGIGNALTEKLGLLGSLLSLALTLAASVFSTAYVLWVLKFVRGEEASINTIIDCAKEKWSQILITVILVSVYIILWSLLFVIPGIIKALAYTMALYLVVDTDLTGNDAIKESMRMMDGYKWNYFVFQLSFLGWCLLAPLTLGILYIWLIPYMTVAEAIYYERLKEKTGVVSTVATEPAPEPTPAPVAEEPAPEPVEEKAAEEDTDPISEK